MDNIIIMIPSGPKDFVPIGRITIFGKDSYFVREDVENFKNSLDKLGIDKIDRNVWRVEDWAGEGEARYMHVYEYYFHFSKEKMEVTLDFGEPVQESIILGEIDARLVEKYKIVKMVLNPVKG